MSAEPVKRNRYEGPGTHSPGSHAEDYQNFHLPLDRMHHAALHGWGVAEGLEVKFTPGDTGVLVEAGIAVDAAGHLMTLAVGPNNAVVWIDPAKPNTVTAADVPTRLDTAGFAGQEPRLYVTIQYYEEQLPGGTGGQLAQAPYLRLQPAAGPPLDEIANGTALVLAIVTIDAQGNVTALQAASPDLPFCRRSVGQTVEALQVRRTVVENNTTVKEALAGTIAADAAGGLRISAGLSVGGGLAVNGSIDLRETSGEINTDPFWIDRQSQGFNKSDLRIVIGDDIGGDDRLVIGPIPHGQTQMSEKFIFRNNGSALFSGKLEIEGDVILRSPDSGIHSLKFARTDESGRAHEWAMWHMNSAYRKNALEIWEYKTDSNGQNCGGNVSDGAMCNPRLVILEGGNVGIGTTDPGSYRLMVAGGDTRLAAVGHEQALFGLDKLVGLNDLGFYVDDKGDAEVMHLSANGLTVNQKLDVVGAGLGIRQNKLYLSGDTKGSSLSYNAHRNADNTDWVFPEPSRNAVTLELDDTNKGNARFQIWTTTTKNKKQWELRLNIDGDSGNVGIGTFLKPEKKLHVEGDTLLNGHLFIRDQLLTQEKAKELLQDQPNYTVLFGARYQKKGYGGGPYDLLFFWKAHDGSLRRAIFYGEQFS